MLLKNIFLLFEVLIEAVSISRISRNDKGKEEKTETNEGGDLCNI